LLRDIVAKNGNTVEATGNTVACCFDSVACVDRALDRYHNADCSDFIMASWHDKVAGWIGYRYIFRPENLSRDKISKGWISSG